jgi:hypothetical protein
MGGKGVGITLQRFAVCRTYFRCLAPAATPGDVPQSRVPGLATGAKQNNPAALLHFPPPTGCKGVGLNERAIQHLVYANPPPPTTRCNLPCIGPRVLNPATAAGFLCGEGDQRELTLPPEPPDAKVFP